MTNSTPMIFAIPTLFHKVRFGKKKRHQFFFPTKFVHESATVHRRAWGNMDIDKVLHVKDPETKATVTSGQLLVVVALRKLHAMKTTEMWWVSPPFGRVHAAAGPRLSSRTSLVSPLNSFSPSTGTLCLTTLSNVFFLRKKSTNIYYSVPKYKHLLISTDYVWLFVLFKKIEKNKNN